MAKYLTMDGRKKPYISLKLIKRLASKIYSRLLLFADRKIGSDELLEMSKRLVDIFKPPKPETIIDCVLPLYDTTPDKNELEIMSWRLAANAKRIRNSIPVPYWVGQTKEEPAICQFICPEDPEAEISGYMRYHVLTGLAAGVTGRIYLSNDAGVLVCRRLSFDKGIFRMSQLSAITFVCVLQPSRAKYPRFSISSVGTTKKIRQRNALLMDLWYRSKTEYTQIIARNAYYIPVVIGGKYTKDLVISF